MWGISCLAEKLFAFQEVLNCTEYVVTFVCVHYKHANQSVSVMLLTYYAYIVYLNEVRNVEDLICKSLTNVQLVATF